MTAIEMSLGAGMRPLSDNEENLARRLEDNNIDKSIYRIRIMLKAGEGDSLSGSLIVQIDGGEMDIYGASLDMFGALGPAGSDNLGGFTIDSLDDIVVIRTAKDKDGYSFELDEKASVAQRGARLISDIEESFNCRVEPVPIDKG